MGHCDNPLRGIYNPCQIKKKQPFAYLVYRRLVTLHTEFFLKSSNKTMYVITTPVADKTQNLSFRHVHSHENVLCSDGNSLKH